MAARYNDPEIDELVLDMSESGLGCLTISELTGLCKSTVRWIVRRSTRVEPRYTCPRCGCRCEWPQGHESWCNEWLQQRYRVGAA
jgi:hypothetical protein